jgi:hypothetical protein
MRAAHTFHLHPHAERAQEPVPSINKLPVLAGVALL